MSSLDLLQASHVGAVLYVEDESDYKILREWAAVLQHPSLGFLSFPFVWPLRGKGSLGDAKRHFSSLRLAEPTIKGLCILDRDADGQRDFDEDVPPGMQIRRWGRYEIENYLLNPAILRRYIDRPTDLFGGEQLAGDRASIDDAFARNFPAAIDWHSDTPVLTDLKASEFLVDTLGRTTRPLAKREALHARRPDPPRGDSQGCPGDARLGLWHPASCGARSRRKRLPGRRRRPERRRSASP